MSREKLINQPLTHGRVHRQDRLAPCGKELAAYARHAPFICDRLRARGIARLTSDVRLVLIKVFGALKFIARGFRGGLRHAQIGQRRHERRGIQHRGRGRPLARHLQHLNRFRLDAEILALRSLQLDVREATRNATGCDENKTGSG